MNTTEQHIRRHATQDAIIASCTSSIDADILAGLADAPEQLLIAHPFQPAHMLPLVEIVCHAQTSRESLERTLSLLERPHRQTVVLKRSVPGFLVNRLAQTSIRIYAPPKNSSLL